MLQGPIQFLDWSYISLSREQQPSTGLHEYLQIERILAPSYAGNISYFKMKITVPSAQQRKNKDYPVQLIEIFASSV
jgi:hypothetical protein